MLPWWNGEVQWVKHSRRAIRSMRWKMSPFLLLREGWGEEGEGGKDSSQHVLPEVTIPKGQRRQCQDSSETPSVGPAPPRRPQRGSGQGREEGNKSGKVSSRTPVLPILLSHIPPCLSMTLHSGGHMTLH